jgi:hypothetical protein
MAQYARPSADILIAGWSNQTSATTNLWQSIDEVTASETDFVQSSLTVNDSYECRLSTTQAALIRRGHILRYRGRKSQATGNVRGVTVELRQGTTVIATNSHPDLTVAWLDGAIQLTPEQAALITNYADLRVRFTATGSVASPAGNRRRVQISWVQLRVPEATFGAVEDLSEPGVWKYTLNGVTGVGPSREDALVDLFTKLREINEAIENPDANQLTERATLSLRFGYVYYARKIKDYTDLRARIVNGTYQLPPHQNIPEELVNLDEKLARFDAITSIADSQDGG